MKVVRGLGGEPIRVCLRVCPSSGGKRGNAEGNGGCWLGLGGRGKKIGEWVRRSPIE